MNGYSHRLFLRSLAAFGTPRKLPRCGGWILEREIPESPYRDAMGIWPQFFCEDWTQLHADLADIGKELICLTVVTDPFGKYTLTQLEMCFPDLVIPFKDSFVIDLTKPINVNVSKHHRYYARKALKKIQVEVCQEPLQFLDEWILLHHVLIERHHLPKIRAFSPDAFESLLSIPCLIMLRAVYESKTVGAQLYLRQGDVVHCHLGAASEIGYQLGAMYAMDWFSIKYFSDQAPWLNLGGGVGISGDQMDGLSRYKHGWTNNTRTMYLCGRIFDNEKYTEILNEKHLSPTTYFPAYRQGEFS